MPNETDNEEGARGNVSRRNFFESIARFLYRRTTQRGATESQSVRRSRRDARMTVMASLQDSFGCAVYQAVGGATRGAEGLPADGMSAAAKKGISARPAGQL